MTRTCKTISLIYLLLYLAALGLLAVGTFGWFGAERDPLAGVYLVPLGFPWTLLISGAPDWLAPWLAIASPAINLVLITAICHLARSRQASIKNI